MADRIKGYSLHDACGELLPVGGVCHEALNPNVKSELRNLPPLGTLIEVDICHSSRPRKYTWFGKIRRYFDTGNGLGIVVSDGEYLQHLWPGSVEYKVIRYPEEEFDCENAKWRLV